MANLETDGSAVLSITVAQTPAETVVALTGELDFSNADQLEAPLDKIIDAGAERLVFDVGDLRFMDSSGIAQLLRAAARVTSVSVRHPSVIVRRVLEATGLTSVLHLQP